jgi:hypothetical protein
MTHRRAPLALALLIGVTLISAILAGCSEREAPATGAGTPPLGEGEQVELQTSIVSDREHLFRGVLTYLPLDPMPVDSTQEMHVTLVAIGENPAAVKVAPGEVVGSRSMQVGGIEEARLSARGGGADISAVGPTRGLIGEPGDKLSWTWDITPKEPREYELELVVITYQGTSNNPLSVVNPPIKIDLEVNNTFSHWISSMKAWLIGLGAVAVAAAAIWKFGTDLFSPIRRLMTKRGPKRSSQPQGSKPRTGGKARTRRRQGKRVRAG